MQTMIKGDHHDSQALEKNEIHEECGVFGVFGVEDASALTYYGLHALQHRGQEGCGIASMEQEQMMIHKGKGLVSEVFHDAQLNALKGKVAIGHVRYSTAGGNEMANIQPLFANLIHHQFAVVHNGQIVNAQELRLQLESMGSIFQGTSDSEIILHLIQRAKGSFLERIKSAFRQLEGAFACLILCADGIYAIRDDHGLRPLSYAKWQSGYVISSESCGFDVLNAELTQDIKPGEIVWFHNDGIHKDYYRTARGCHLCAMEYIYFARPDSVIDGINVHEARVSTGVCMAKKDRAAALNADIVIGVPDSSTSAAIGYAKESGLPYEIGLIKNRYVGRTFIQPTQVQRERGVRMKLSAIKAIVTGKRVVLIDDSIVRGTTSRRIVRLLKEAGAKAVHVRIAAPPITYPCFYGVDTSSFDELISARMNVEELRAYLNADSLRFMEINDLIESYHSEALCFACFNGQYTTKLFSYGAIIDAYHDAQGQKPHSLPAKKHK